MNHTLWLCRCIEYSIPDILAILKTQLFIPITELIVKAGYPVESHHVTTADGYILTLHRIPHGRTNNHMETIKGSPGGRAVAFMQHGLLCGSACWILNEPNNVGAYNLADAGYDVWLGNARGSKYSRNHTYLDPSEREFWQFSWDEMGKFDIPAVIDYILASTQKEQLSYIGHSMGTTMFWVAMSEHPEYNSKIRVMFALGPVAYVSNIVSPIRFLSPFIKEMEVISNFLGDYEFFPETSLFVSFRKMTCKQHNRLTVTMCENSLFFFAGFDPVHFNEDRLQVILTHEPEGTSVNTVFHYAQMINTGTFQKFDFGRRHNLAKYGQEAPPQYNLTKVTAPVVLMSAQNDWLADPKVIIYSTFDLKQPKIYVFDVREIWDPSLSCIIIILFYVKVF
ncbi:unnamed protein product, partial [Meganyctiphanes norvegica]